jgi:hypothetical protein
VRLREVVGGRRAEVHAVDGDQMLAESCFKG